VLDGSDGGSAAAAIATAGTLSPHFTQKREASRIGVPQFVQNPIRLQSSQIFSRRRRYNHVVKVSVLAVLMLCLVGCNKGGIDTKEAVRQGVIDYLAGRQDINVSSMNLEVTAVTFKENEAEATVAFMPKGGGATQPVSFNYTLERKGNRWVVKPKSTSSGKNPHGMPMSENPHGTMPPAGGEMPGGGAMPPGHPAVPKK
jgi:hypothetical protein